jgi:hypothetical protein
VSAALDTEAAAGFARQANPHLSSSPAWCAHELGRYFQESGRTAPTDVRMGRGYSIRVRDMRFAIGHGTPVTFDRVE